MVGLASLDAQLISNLKALLSHSQGLPLSPGLHVGPTALYRHSARELEGLQKLEQKLWAWALGPRIHSHFLLTPTVADFTVSIHHSMPTTPALLMDPVGN